MAVLIQELLSPSYSFVLHTASPMGNDPATAEFEVSSACLLHVIDFRAGEGVAAFSLSMSWCVACKRGEEQNI